MTRLTQFFSLSPALEQYYSARAESKSRDEKNVLCAHR